MTILGGYVKKCVQGLHSDEDDLNVKRELTFAMLQIFREHMTLKMIPHDPEIPERDENDVDYELLDKIVRRIKFFKSFE